MVGVDADEQRAGDNLPVAQVDSVPMARPIDDADDSRGDGDAREEPCGEGQFCAGCGSHGVGAFLAARRDRNAAIQRASVAAVMGRVKRNTWRSTENQR